MRRRDLLAALGSAAAAAPARAQVPGRAPNRGPARLGWIAAGTAPAEVARLASMRAGLKDNGLSENDYVLDVFYADGDYLRFPALVQQALAHGPAVLLVNTIACVRAAQQATKTIPIVFMATNDPVGAGLIDSLARPGGNTTGVATMADRVMPKLVDMTRRALPAVRRVAVLINPDNPTNRPIFESTRAAAGMAGIEVQAIEVASPEAIASGIATAIDAPSAPRPDAMIVALDAMLMQTVDRITQLCIERRIAALGSTRELADAGGLLSYGPSLDTLIRRSAYFVKRVLTGTPPRDLPTEQPTTFELTLNLRTARAIGIAIPQSVLAEADNLIE